MGNTQFWRGAARIFLWLGVAALAGDAARGAISLTTTVSLPAGSAPCPIAVRHSGDHTRSLFILDHRGYVWKRNPASPTQVIATPFLDIHTDVQNGGGCGDEQGMLGLDFSPTFATDHFFYVYYTRSADSDEEIERFDASLLNADGTAPPAARHVVMIMCDPASNHNGGNILFGPRDGYLYIGTGDGGSGCDGSGSASGADCIPAPSGPHSQNILTNSVLGKILRIDPSGDDFPGGDPLNANRNYAIPPTNPFHGSGTNAPEIWYYGVRNPWRWSFDKLTGDFWLADVGQDNYEEVDYLPAQGGGTTLSDENWGWVCCEGTHDSDFADPNNGGHQSCPGQNHTHCSGITSCAAASSNYLPPLFDLDHAVDGVCAIIGGYRYRGLSVRDLRPNGFPVYLFTDNCNSTMWAATSSNGGQTWTRTVLEGGTGDYGFTVNSFGEDERGELWVTDVTSTPRKVHQLTDPGSIFSDGFELGDTADWSSTVP